MSKDPDFEESLGAYRLLASMVIKVEKAGLNGGNDESDIKSRLAANYVYE